MSTINWTISALNCYPESEGQTNVVFTVHWRCDGSQEIDGKTYHGSVYSTTGISYTSGSTYIPYANLTKEDVLGWVWNSGIDKNSIEAAVQLQINNAVNPPVITPVLPWEN